VFLGFKTNPKKGIAEQKAPFRGYVWTLGPRPRGAGGDTKKTSEVRKRKEGGVNGVSHWEKSGIIRESTPVGQ